MPRPGNQALFASPALGPGFRVTHLAGPQPCFTRLVCDRARLSQTSESLASPCPGPGQGFTSLALAAAKLHSPLWLPGPAQPGFRGTCLPRQRPLTLVVALRSSLPCIARYRWPGDCMKISLFLFCMFCRFLDKAQPMLVQVGYFCTSNLPSGTALQQDFVIRKVG